MIVWLLFLIPNNVVSNQENIHLNFNTSEEFSIIDPVNLSREKFQIAQPIFHSSCNCNDSNGIAETQKINKVGCILMCL